MRRGTPATRATWRALVAGLVLILGAGCDGGSSGPPPPVERVAQELAGAGGKSVIVLVADDGREYTATGGTRHPGGDQRFRIGSVTKTFTATIVLQLVSEGRLRLDDTLERHLPGIVPEGERITIRQLLQHRSGLPNVTDYTAWLRQASRSASTQPIGTLRFAASKPLVFSPGSRWGYSNTNYIALGLVIERVTGRSYRQELEQRLIEPLGLARTELPRTRRVAGLNDAGENPSLPWAAGALVSDTRDLVHFFSELLAGRILSREALGQMRATVPVDSGGFGDGLGLFSTELPCGRFWGHDGGILDYVTSVRASEDGERVMVISVHGGSLSGPPPDEAALLCETT